MCTVLGSCLHFWLSQWPIQRAHGFSKVNAHQIAHQNEGRAMGNHLQSTSQATNAQATRPEPTSWSLITFGCCRCCRVWISRITIFGMPSSSLLSRTFFSAITSPAR